MTWKIALQKGHEIILASSSKKCNPRAIVVISLGFVDNELLIGACQMKITLENIRENNRVSIVTKYKNEYYRIDGNATIYSSGKYFDIALERSKPPLPKHVVVVDIKEVYDLDKLKKVN
jgi:hypothetical protein